MSVAKAKEITTFLSWNDYDKETFTQLVRAAHSRSEKDIEAAIEILINKKNELNATWLEDEDFKRIAEPFHYIIIEALKLNNIEPTLEGLNQVLDYSKIEIKDAVSRLINLNLIKTIEGNLFVDEYVLKIGGNVSSMALRKHHSIVINKALDSINTQNIKERTLSSLAVAIPEGLIPEVFEKINDFRQEINSFIRNHDNQEKDGIYCLSAQFFKVSK